MTTPPDPWPAVAERLEADVLPVLLDWARQDKLSVYRADFGSGPGALVSKSEILSVLERAASDRARAEAAERRVGELSEELSEMVDLLNGVEVFVKSREQINRPTGREWFDKRLARARTALASGSADRGGEG